MNIVLLSGGSGKRLWPLSNDTRSKQFLKVIKNRENNEYESMIQRVYRQITSVFDDKNILVTTGETQVDSVLSQIGNVDVVVEPERRDTFPAIALAAAYLAYEKKIDINENLVICPVDSYVEESYFDNIAMMEKVLNEEETDICLIGIKPTYASEKYGYIVPENGKKVDKVCRFKEKPTVGEANKLIQEGALWNGGVFGIKLGKLIKMIKKYIEEDDYMLFKSQYNKLPKTSFDYEIVERAKCVTVIKYDGIWKDLGTWNTLSEEIDEHEIGNVLVDNTTVNTTVINELSIPMVVLGGDNLVIAASQDGILVTDKPKSSFIKPYVDKIDARPMYEEKRWGDYKVLDYDLYKDGEKSLTKHPEYELHCLRDEIWTVIDGIGDLCIEGHVRNVRRGDIAYITKGQKHSMQAITDLHYIEVQIGSELTEKDREIFEWKW